MSVTLNTKEPKIITDTEGREYSDNFKPEHTNLVMYYNYQTFGQYVGSHAQCHMKKWAGKRQKYGCYLGQNHVLIDYM